MHFDVDELERIKLCRLSQESPTKQLLSLWGQRNHTVSALFYLLYEMQLYRAMLVLKPYGELSNLMLNDNYFLLALIMSLVSSHLHTTQSEHLKQITVI